MDRRDQRPDMNAGAYKSTSDFEGIKLVAEAVVYTGDVCDVIAHDAPDFRCEAVGVAARPFDHEFYRAVGKISDVSGDWEAYGNRSRRVAESDALNIAAEDHGPSDKTMFLI